MALTFTFVPPIATGDPVTSTQLNAIADGFNDRLRCNAGDACERIVFALFTQFRLLRNSDGGSVFPPQAYFFQNFQNLTAQDGSYPDGDPGDVEGANLACILNSFVFGAEAINLESEDLRVAEPAVGGVPLWYSGSVPSDPEGIWELGKQQRGAVSTDGALASPSFSAAVEHYKIRTNNMSFHGNSYGGFMPVPVDAGGCSDPAFPNYEIFFTNLKDGTVKSYPGTCPEIPGAVATVITTPRWYLVFLNDGAVDVLPFDDWIQGPYAGGSAIKRNWGDFLPRALNAFANDFRGTQSELDTQTTWLQFAFDREKFLTSQYMLAPNIGTASGDTVSEIYPLFQGNGPALSAGAVLTHTQSGGSSHAYATDFVCTGAFLKTHLLTAPCAVEFWNGATLLGSVTLTPDGSGNAPALVMFDPAVSAPVLSVKLPNGATFTDGTGWLKVETTELLEYKPQTHDLYLMLRLASCRTSLVSGLDGSGNDETTSNEISDSYFANGCVLNSHGAPGPAGTFTGEVNSNAVFDAARRLSQFVRILPRDGFMGYAVEDGKSICWFRRYNSVGMDQFDGIAPSRAAISSGSLVAGKAYVVRGNTVTYNSGTIAQDATFTAVAGVLTFTGDGLVYEREGILHVAFPEGFTNESLMGVQLKVYKDVDDSIWKPAAYSDFYFLSERCQWLPQRGFTFPRDLRNQFDYGENFSAAPEAFSGWRYVHNTNNFADDGNPDFIARKKDRYKSCRIYEPLPELDSVTEDFEAGVAVVKLVFTGRFHHHDDAPSAVYRDVSTWDITGLRAETYRTMENGLREYLLLQDRGFNCTRGGANNANQQGNSGYYAASLEDVDPWTMDDLPWGACFPHFYFVKLFPKPWEDGNDVQDSSDSPLWANQTWPQADLYLRYMCEGFVDGETTVDLACDLGENSIFCYTFESLCFQSHGLKSLTTIATQPTRLLPNVREDAPMGFGQAPAISLAAECYNQVAGCLNLLTKVQIMLPQKFQARQNNGSADMNVSASWPTSSPPTCEVGGSPVGYYQGGAADSGTSAGAWGDALSAASSVSASILPDACSGDSWIVRTNRSDSEWRWALTDPDAFYALPEPWQSIFSDDGGEKVSLQGRVVAIQSTETNRITVRTVTDICQSSVCSDEIDVACGDGRLHGYWIDTGAGYLRFDVVSTDTSECIILGTGGVVSAPQVPSSVYPIGRDIHGGSCFSGPDTFVHLAPVFGVDMAFVEIPLV